MPSPSLYRTRAAPTVAALAALAIWLLSAAPANAVPWSWDDAYTQDVFVSGCGTTTTISHDLRPGASNIKMTSPHLGDKFQDDLNGADTMTLTKAEVVRSKKARSAAWTFTGTDDLCTNPSAYQANEDADRTDTGSNAYEVPFRVRYRTTERVYVLGDLTVKQATTPAWRVFHPYHRPHALTFWDTRGHGAKQQTAFSHLSGLKWTKWDGPRATGHGTLRWNDCKPNCDHGQTHPYPVAVKLHSIAPCSNDPDGPQRDFTALEYLGMTYHFTNTTPPHAPHQRNVAFSCQTILTPGAFGSGGS
jgi:hypothetical protein